MSGRSQLAREATKRVSYADASENDDSDSDAGGRTMTRPKSGKRAEAGPEAIGEEDDESGSDQSSDGSASDDADDEDYGARPKQKKKKLTRKRKAKAKPAKKAGKLELFKMLPLELLGEIFSQLHPCDLLALRTLDKRFHQILSDKASELIWAASRRRVGLPDVELHLPLTEWQYAELVLGKTCQGCHGDDVRTVYHDLFLRKNFCTSCRHIRIVDLDNLDIEEPKLYASLHPFAIECVRRSPHSGVGNWTNNTRGAKHKYACADDLMYLSVIIQGLDEQDEDSDIAAGRESGIGLPRPAVRSNTRASTPRRSRARGSRGKAKLVDEDADEDEGEDYAPRRANEFRNERKKMLAELSEDGFALRAVFAAYREAAADASREQARHATAKRATEAAAINKGRKEQIKARLLEEHPEFDELVGASGYAYGAEAFSSGLERYSVGGPLDDDEWHAIKDKVVSLARRVEKYRTASFKRDELRNRQNALRPRYTSLRNGLEPGVSPFLPLYDDFLRFESVEAIWQGDEEINDELWEASLADILEELDNRRVDLCSYARKIILDATRGPCTDESEYEEDDVALGDSFFDLATSVICCGHPHCPNLWHNTHRDTQNWNRINGDRGGSARSIGSLVEVLRHQHAGHSDGWTDPFSAEPPRYLVRLSTEVACAMSSVLALHRLDSSKARLSELDEADKPAAGYKWLNSKQHKQQSWTWLTLLQHVDRQAFKAAKVGLCLDPPRIAFRTQRDARRAANRLIGSKSEDDEGVDEDELDE